MHIPRKLILPTRHRLKALNLIGLIGGFGAGQGLQFVAQTWLLANGKTAFLGRYGVAYTIVSLFYQLVDFGGLVILARISATQSVTDAEIADGLWSLSAFRFLLALAVVLLAILFWFAFGRGTFEGSYELTASIGLLIYACNAGGVLDGKNLSGWTGTTWGIPFLLTAILLPPCSQLPLPQAGYILGIAFSCGAGATVVAQHAVLRSQGMILALTRPKSSIVFLVIKEGILYLMTTMPGQILYRVQIGSAALLEGVVAAGLITYVKQILSGIFQLQYFVRRIEFPVLVKTTLANSSLFYSLVVAQRLSLALAALFFVLTAVSGIILTFFGSPSFHRIGLLLIAFTPSSFAVSCGSSLTQLCAATSRLHVSAMLYLGVVAGLGTVLTFGLCALLGIFGIPAAEAVTFLILISSGIFILRRQQRAS
jgi:hypothetical protein